MKHTVLCIRTRSLLQTEANRVLQHQRGQKHAKVKQAGKSQPEFEVTAGSVQVNCSDTKWMLSSEEQISHAEISLFLDQCNMTIHSILLMA
jgi:hypothetical protein